MKTQDQKKSNVDLFEQYRASKKMNAIAMTDFPQNVEQLELVRVPPSPKPSKKGQYEF